MEKTFDLVITLKAIPFEERNQIVSGLSENHGLLSVVAKNSVQSKRFGGALGLFHASVWGFESKTGRDLGTLLEATTRYAFDGIRADFLKLSAASLMSEVIQRILQPAHPANDLFKLLSNALFELESLTGGDEKPVFGVCNGFLMKILQWTGHQPQLAACVECRKPLEEAVHERVYAEPSRGTWTCAMCADGSSAGAELSGAALLDLKVLSSFPIRKAIPLLIEDVDGQRALFRFLHRTATYHVGGLDRTALKSAQFLEEMR